MKPEEIRYLLGGYASGTLSEEEQRLLFSAALDDQELFDALAEEQALKEVFDDPESRGYLQAALEERKTEDVEAHPELMLRTRMPVSAAMPSAPMAVPAPVAAAVPATRRNPVAWGLLAAALLSGVTVVGLLQWNRGQPQPNPMVIAVNVPPPAPAPSARDKGAPEPTRGPVIEKPKSKPPVLAKKPASAVVATDASGPAIPNTAKSEAIVGEARASRQQPESLPLTGRVTEQPPPQAGQAAPLVAPQQQQASPPAPGSGGALADSVTAPQLAFKERSSAPVELASARAKKAASSPGPITYRLLRKAVPVPSATVFTPGDEIVLHVQKNTSGTVEITRASGEPVAMAFQTKTEAQTVPLTVAAGMDLIIAFQPGKPSGVPPVVERLTIVVR